MPAPSGAGKGLDELRMQVLPVSAEHKEPHPSKTQRGRSRWVGTGRRLDQEDQRIDFGSCTHIVVEAISGYCIHEAVECFFDSDYVVRIVDDGTINQQSAEDRNGSVPRISAKATRKPISITASYESSTVYSLDSQTTQELYQRNKRRAVIGFPLLWNLISTSID